MEEFYPGDKVEFIDDKTVGTIISIINTKQVLVDIEGMDIPVLKAHLIRISEGPEKASSLAEKYRDDLIPQKKEPQLALGTNKGIFLSMSIGNSPELFLFHLLNDSSSSQLFRFFTKDKHGYKAIDKGEICSWSSKLILQHDQSKGDDFPALILNLMSFRFEDKEPQQPILFSLKPTGKDLLKKQEKAPLLNSQAWLYKIEIQQQHPIPKIEFLDEPEEDIIAVEVPKKEIDLHIDQIDPNFKFMGRDEIFQVQYNYCIKEVEKAIAFNYESLIIIHGIGVNTLKDKIREYLKNNIHTKFFQDADVRKYGFGATEVFFKK